MELKDCTKQELIQIIEQNFGEEEIACGLEEIKKQRQGALRLMLDVYAELAEETMAEHRALMAPYTGVPTIEIPMDVMEKAWRLMRTTHEAGKVIERLEASTRFIS